MLQKKNLHKVFKIMTFIVVAGAPMVTASVPRSSQSNEIANDTAIYQNLHEINVKRVKAVSFDADINSLSAQEKSYHESLPARLGGPMDRIQKSKYQYHRSKSSKI